MTAKVRNVIRPNTNREKAWKVMRAMITFTLSDVVITADVPYENIRHYVDCLLHAGYVRKDGKKRIDGRPGFDVIYRLIKNTGPKPPVQKALRYLFDPNNNTYWCEADDSNESLRGSAMQGKAGQSAASLGAARQGGGVRPSQKFVPLLCPRMKKGTPESQRLSGDIGKEGSSNVA